MKSQLTHRHSIPLHIPYQYDIHHKQNQILFSKSVLPKKTNENPKRMPTITMRVRAPDVSEEEGGYIHHIVPCKLAWMGFNAVTTSSERVIRERAPEPEESSSLSRDGS